MKIVYFSNLDGSKSAGLSYSVPSQIDSQSKIDDVYWYNINSVEKERIKLNITDCIFNTSDYVFKKFTDLPNEFKNPDLVIFQGVYHPGYIKISKECVKNRIPYIIIPRSSLTKEAQNKKKIKKIMGNLILFKRFIRNASAIQYLTQKEYEDSGDKWNEKSLIIPNGIRKNNFVAPPKSYNEENYLTGVFIGRAEKYQKGLDLLLEACEEIKLDLIENKIKFKIYAASSTKDHDDIAKIVSNKKLNELFEVYDGIFGDEKKRALQNSDFFVLTSRFEGLSMGMIEALSYGLPVLITEGTNMGKEVEDSNAGWVADTSVNGIKVALRDLIKEKDTLLTKGKNAKVLSLNYDWDKIAQDTHLSYEELINEIKTENK